MSRICTLSRRWHQQFFPFVTHFGHRQCLQRLWLPAQHQQRQYARGRKDDFVVHEFEQLGTDKKTRVAINPKAEFEELKKYLESKINSLEKELAVMRKGPFAAEGKFMQSLSPEDRKLALEALEKEGGGETAPFDLDDTDMSEIDRLIEDQDLEEEVESDGEPVPQVILKHAEKYRASARYFNATLKDMVKEPTTAKKISLWVLYQKCRFRVPDFVTSIPPQVFQILWDSIRSVPGGHRYVRRLAQDMIAVSVPLTAEQVLLYMKCLRLAGELDLAIKVWNQNRTILGPDALVAKRFWALGVQLYSENDDPDLAQNIANQCLAHGSFADATVLMPVISSWARKGSTNDLEKAWACYLRFKAELGSSIGAKDYESISTQLLHQGQTQMALTVFKDMVLDKAAPRYQSYESLASFIRLVAYVGKLQSSAITEQEINRISLTALTVLPRFLQNKFFFAAWLKKLIGLGELDAACKVVELMYERGIKPDAKHVNGIVGAWLREGSEPSRHRAEQMCWAMINARIDFVSARETKNLIPPKVEPPNDPKIPVFITRNVPIATIETFSVLLLHYTRRSKDEVAQELMYTMMHKAQIAPNVFIWNHWLYASLRAHDLPSVWTHYETMLHRGVIPDLQTFACLWDTAKMQWDTSRSAHSDRIPTARHLFLLMNNWLSALPAIPLRKARHDFSRSVHDQIIRVFCLSRDVRGTLCALHGLAHLFAIYPDQTTTRILCISIARLLPATSSQALKPGDKKVARIRVSKMAGALNTVTELLQIVTDQRVVKMMELEEGWDPQKLDEDQQNRFRLDVLSDLLVVVLNRSAPRSAHVDNEVGMAARAMGVSVEGVDFRKERYVRGRMKTKAKEKETEQVVRMEKGWFERMEGKGRERKGVVCIAHWRFGYMMWPSEIDLQSAEPVYNVCVCGREWN